MKLKHIMVTGKQQNISYQRRFSSVLRDHPQVRGKPVYRKALGVTTADTDADILAAWEHAHAIYEEYAEGLRSANIDQLSQAEKIRRAEALIEAKGLEAGMLSADPLLTEAQQEVLYDAALAQVEGSGAVDSVVYRHRDQRKGAQVDTEVLPAQEEIEAIAWRILAEPKQSTGRNKTLLFSECFDLWATAQGIDKTTRDGGRSHKMWLEFIRLSGGDRLVTQETAQDAVDAYVQAKIATGVKGSSADTWTKKNLAILRRGIKERKLPIVIQKPTIPAATHHEDDYVLTEGEEKALLAIIRGGTLEPWKAAALSLMLEVGCYASELQRLDLRRAHLKHKSVPHIILKNDTMKTKHRARVLVPVATIDVIQVGMKHSGWSHFQGMTESNVSHQLRTIIRKVAPEATARSLRHGTRNRLLSAGVPLDVQYLIGGWAGGINKVALGYGRGGATDERTLKTLQKHMREANSAFCEPISDNVVPLKAAKGK